MLRPVLVTFLIAMLSSFLIFSLYRNSQGIKEGFDALAIQESSNINRCGAHVKKFELRSYPETADSGLTIGIDENESYSGGKAVRLSSAGYTERHYAGIHLYLTLDLGRHLKKTALEFWIKGGERSSLIEGLSVYLREGPVSDKMVVFFQPLKIDKDWKRVSIPLEKFSLIAEEGRNLKDREFRWGVQEVLFSVAAVDSNGPVELFIDDLKMIKEGKVLYDLS